MDFSTIFGLVLGAAGLLVGIVQTWITWRAWRDAADDASTDDGNTCRSSERLDASPAPHTCTAGSNDQEHLAPGVLVYPDVEQAGARRERADFGEAPRSLS